MFTARPRAALVLPIAMGALLVSVSAAADVPPVYRKGEPVYVEACPEAQRAGLECLLATKGEPGLGEDVAQQLRTLGFTKRCEESHNDRYTGHWCRRPDAKHPVPDALPESLRGGTLDRHAARRMQVANEELCLRWLGDNPGVPPSSGHACDAVLVRGVTGPDAGGCEEQGVSCVGQVTPPPAFMVAWDAGAITDAGADATEDAGAATVKRSEGCGRCAMGQRGAPAQGPLAAALAIASVLALRRFSGRRHHVP